MQDGFSGFLKDLVMGGAGYVWFFLLALWGGTVNYISRLKKDKEIKFSAVELVGEWTISGFTGLLTAYICTMWELPWQATAVFTGIAGHMGGRAIFIFEEAFKAKLRKLKGIIDE